MKYKNVHISVESNDKKQAEDVFDFKVDEEPTEPLKTVDRQKQTAAVEPLVEPSVEVAKTNCEETPVVPAKVGTARESMRSKAQPIQSSQVVQQPQHVQTTASSPVSATVPSPSSVSSSPSSSPASPPSPWCQGSPPPLCIKYLKSGSLINS